MFPVCGLILVVLALLCVLASPLNTKKKQASLRLESLETRYSPTGVLLPVVDVVYLGTPSGSQDAVVRSIAQQVAGGQIVSSTSSPFNFGYSTGAIDNALRLDLFFHKIPYNGLNTTIVVVTPAGVGTENGQANHGLLSFLGGQIPEAVFPLNASTDGLKFDFSSISDGYFTTDPSGPFVYNSQGVLQLPPGPDSSADLRAPNFYLGYFLFYELASQIHFNTGA